MPLSCVFPADFNEPDNFFFSLAMWDTRCQPLCWKCQPGALTVWVLVKSRGSSPQSQEVAWRVASIICTGKGTQLPRHRNMNMIEYDQWDVNNPSGKKARYSSEVFLLLLTMRYSKNPVCHHQIKSIIIRRVEGICCQCIIQYLPYRCCFQAVMLVHSLPVKPTRNEKSCFQPLFRFFLSSPLSLWVPIHTHQIFTNSYWSSCCFSVAANQFAHSELWPLTPTKQFTPLSICCFLGLFSANSRDASDAANQ